MPIYVKETITLYRYLGTYYYNHRLPPIQINNIIVSVINNYTNSPINV